MSRSERNPSRTYYVAIRNFDGLDGALIRARSRGRARYLCAAGFHEAGYGTMKEGFQHIGSCRLAPDADEWPLVYPGRGEGFLREPSPVAHDEHRPSVPR